MLYQLDRIPAVSGRPGRGTGEGTKIIAMGEALRLREAKKKSAAWA